MGKDTEDSKERKNRKTAFDRINKKSRSKKDHVDRSDGERSPGVESSDSAVASRKIF